MLMTFMYTTMYNASHFHIFAGVVVLHHSCITIIVTVSYDNYCLEVLWTVESLPDCCQDTAQLIDKQVATFHFSNNVCFVLMYVLGCPAQHPAPAPASSSLLLRHLHTHVIAFQCNGI